MVTQRSRLLRGVMNVDWRLWAIFFALIVSIIGTLLVYALPIDRNPGQEFGAVFASWVGGLALFVVVGAAVAIASIVRPEHESFDARARILFRRATGKHVDYIVLRIKDILEHYAESTEIILRIMNYNDTEKKFLIGVSDRIRVRSYLDDVETSFESNIEYAECTHPPPGCHNRLVFAKIDNINIGATEDFDDHVIRKIKSKIDRDSTCTIEFLTELWQLANDEPYEHEPVRYTQQLSLDIENFIATEPRIDVKILLQESGASKEVIIPYGTRKRICEPKELLPGRVAYAVRFLAP